MIAKHRNGSLLLKFGTGDISIHIGGSKGCGFLAFKGQEPREIGASKHWGSAKRAKTDAFPISMIFTSAGSIDVFIQTLAIAKKIMIGEIRLDTKKRRRKVDNVFPD